MDYTVKLPAIQGDIIPLAYVADCMAQAKAKAFGATPFHKQRFDYWLRQYATHLLNEAYEGRLQVCNEFGGPKSAKEIIETTRDSGGLSRVMKYVVEPDWERLRQEYPPVVEGSGVWDFTGIDLGPVETDWEMTHLLCLSVTLHHLNKWGRESGHQFSISSKGVEWIEGWDNKQGELEVSVCGNSVNECESEETQDAPDSVNRDKHEVKPAEQKISIVRPFPGKQPRRAVAQLAVQVAWEIECESNRRATYKEVMSRLQTWATAGDKPDVLLGSDVKNRGVKWITQKGKENSYTIEACQKTLETWYESRE